MSLLQDVKFGLRMMAKNPWFTFVVVLTLALGIGINAGGFSIANATLWKKLPFPDPREIVTIGMSDGTISEDEATLSRPEFLYIRARAHSLKSLAALDFGPMVLANDGQRPERYSGAGISSNLFSFLGIKPIRGRDLTPDDEKPGAPMAILISHDIWQTRYGGKEDTIGRAIRVNGGGATIVGIMPPGIRFPYNQKVWHRLYYPAADRNRSLVVFGRLAKGTRFQDFRSELTAIGEEFARDHPETNKGYRTVALTLLEWANGPETKPVVFTIFGAVGFVLLIACANVANLLLSRAVQRSREASVRTALGASRWRIIRQFLVESVMLSLLGGIFGLAFAEGFVRWVLYLVTTTLEEMPYWMDFGMDYYQFAYFFFICIATGIAFGLVPAIQISRINVNDNLKEGGRGTTGGFRARRITAVLLVTEIALTVVLLAGAGLMIRSFLKLTQVRVGVETAHLIDARLQLTQSKYPNESDQVAFVDVLLERLNTPGEAATVALAAPLTGAWFQPLSLRERIIADKNGKLPDVGVLPVDNGYFSALNIKMARGRNFQDGDGRPGAEVAIVNERFAAKYWPDESPVGKQLRVGDETRPWVNVVGVSQNVFQTDELAFGPDPMVYIPYRQNPIDRISVLIRSTDVNAATKRLRAEVAGLDPDLALYNIQTVDEILRSALWGQRFTGILFGVLALMALVMSCIGLYGVTAHGVNQRTQEIGIRVALGATPLGVVWLFLKQSLKRIVVGLALGLVGATLLTGGVEFVLVVEPTDPLTLLSTSALLAVVTLVACFVPAWRAARLNPVDALRAE